MDLNRISAKNLPLFFWIFRLPSASEEKGGVPKIGSTRDDSWEENKLVRDQDTTPRMDTRVTG